MYETKPRCEECRQPIDRYASDTLTKESPRLPTGTGKCYHWRCVTPLTELDPESRGRFNAWMIETLREENQVLRHRTAILLDALGSLMEKHGLETGELHQDHHAPCGRGKEPKDEPEPGRTGHGRGPGDPPEPGTPGHHPLRLPGTGRLPGRELRHRHHAGPGVQPSTRG